ncbi:hypothetical protein IG631_04636 [Alternaria alternata]|nr:hypothetical protein IG631_04636 [Alternaria alternata]
MTPNAFNWHTGVQEHIVSNTYVPPEAHVGWSYPVTSAPFGGFELSRNDAALQDMNSYSHTTVPETGYTESHVVSTGLYSPSTVDQAVGVRPASFAASQSQPYHVIKKCAIKSCAFRYVAAEDGKHHMQTMHHGMTSCDQCQEVFMSTWNLEFHASNLGHTAFICKQEDCEKGFTRVDTYSRHQRSHQKDARRFPCKYCRKYRGKNGFKRKDHLTQHVRNYHHIGEDSTSSMHWCTWCPKSDCTKSEPAGVARYSAESVFSSSKQWISHMRTEHDECEYSCPQPGCDRVKGKGYFRAADLRTHLRKVHGTDGSFDESIRNKLYPY